jgi:uncharacterized repeat protein (TIGR01451 family)
VEPHFYIHKLYLPIKNKEKESLAMKTRYLIIVFTILLALGVVTVALAAAQSTLLAAPSSVPAALNPVPAARSSVPGAQTSAPVAARNNLASNAPQSLAGSQPADARQAAPRSNSAMMPGFLQANAPQAPEPGKAAWRSPEGPKNIGEFMPGSPGLFMQANYAHNWVFVQTSPLTPITITVAGKDWITGMTNGAGEFTTLDWTWNNIYPPDILPGDIITAVVPGITTGINPVGTVDGALNMNTDTIAGEIDAPFGATPLTVRCEVWEPPYLSIVVPGVPANGGSYSCDFSELGWDFQPGQKVSVVYIEPDADEVMNVFEVPWMRVNYAHDWVGGNYPVGHDMWITVTDSTGGVKATTLAFSSPGGGWGDGFETQDDWDPQRPDIQEGDRVYFESDDGYINEMHVGVITGVVDIDTDSVGGSVYAGWFTQDLPIECHPWGGPPTATVKSSTAGPDGDPPYFCQWDPAEWDIQLGQDVAVMYIEPDGDRVINVFQQPKLNIRTNYGHDWVEGDFEAGHTMWITLTDSTGVIKAFANGVTGPIEWWGGRSGFATNGNVPWLGSRPDIQAGDWVYASLDNGLTAVSHLGVLDAAAEVSYDRVVGTIDAPWYTETLRVDCGIWEDGGPGMGVDGVDPDGGSFTCDFAGTGWDIIPGNTIGVSYNEPDGDMVLNIASNPAPRLHVYTMADGQPAAGSNFLLYVQYRNDGDAPAQNAVISATLEGGMSYLGDTSGLTVTGTGAPGSPLVWQLGTLQPDLYRDTRFDLFVQVAAAAGDWVTNTVQIDDIGVYDQDNPGDRDAQWSGEVIDNHTDLNIGKGAWTGDPAPGSQFVYNVNVCNNGSTDSSEVIVTDTLPLSTTLVSWWGQEPGWEEVSSSTHQLVVSRPTFQGNRCSEVYLRVGLDASAPVGWLLHNEATVFASNDTTLDNNFTAFDHNVGAPHTNLYINKQWNWGVLVPGGEIRYNINYNNNGNIPVSGVRITETLPVNTSFRIAFQYDDNGAHVFTPTLVTDQIVVWEIGALDNGYGGSFEVELKISPQAPPGLELVNTADITRLAGEDTYEDNTSSWTEMLYGHGPNLRVRKTGDWHGYGEGHYAWYNIVVENVGDVYVYSATVTDTLPASMVLEGVPNTDWDRVVSYTYNDTEGWFRFTFRDLHPNWRREINMDLFNTTPEPVVPGGLFFTNTVEITPYEGEPTYADNISQYTLVSGPDLFVEKSLLAGDILPGEEVTFSLAFGNQQVGWAWWWNLQGIAWLTDTLPAGTEFITATIRWCLEGDWCPFGPIVQGDTLTWQLWSIGVGNWNEIHVTVRLPDTLTGMDTVVNQATIASDQPDVDIEPYYDNNTSIFWADVMLPYFEVDKVYESNTVAGMPVVYTLTVSNLGNEAGTTVEVWDWIPDWVDYGGGGTYNAGLITWTVPLIGPGSDATTWFTGTLSCSAGGIVNNQYYFVNSSDQGVTSTVGAPVEFTVAAPDIEVSFQASSLSVLIGETVYFTGTAATDGTALTYDWDFGGDGTAAGPNASHTFDTADSYTVTLTVTDGCGYTAEYSLTVEVSLPSIYLPVVRK